MKYFLQIGVIGLSALLVSACGEPQSEAQAKPTTAKPEVVLSPDAEAGKSLYISKGCIGCHGPSGTSRNPGKFPVLAGQSADYLTEQLLAFKTYKRRNAMMTSVAVNLQDEDITLLSVYLSEL